VVLARRGVQARLGAQESNGVIRDNRLAEGNTGIAGGILPMCRAATTPDKMTTTAGAMRMNVVAPLGSHHARMVAIAVQQTLSPTSSSNRNFTDPPTP
jgi:hypothetical protein